MSRPPDRVLSFLDPAEVQALGGLPPEAIAGALEGDGLSPAGFRPNRVFIEFMHATIREAGPIDPGLQEAARAQRDGWVFVVDLRTPHGPGGAVPRCSARAWGTIRRPRSEPRQKSRRRSPRCASARRLAARGSRLEASGTTTVHH
jgi:hypothetical protein